MNLVITGGTSGIGLETVKSLYPLVDKVILPVRNMEKASKIISTFENPEKFDCIEMDLSSMKSVDEAGKKIAENYPEINILINNAGGMFPSDKKTEEGLDWTFAVNHLGHFHLSNLLTPNLSNTMGRIIFVSSEVHRIGHAPLNDLGLQYSNSSWKSYGNSKLYNILNSKYLSTSLKSKGVTSYSLHPGAVNSSFGSESDFVLKIIITLSKVFFISPEQGAKTSIFLAKTSQNELKSGEYYEKSKIKKPSPKADDLSLQKKVWDYSQKVLEEILS